MEECKDIEKIEARNDTGKVRNYINNLYIIQRQKFDSASYEIEKQKKKK